MHACMISRHLAKAQTGKNVFCVFLQSFSLDSSACAPCSLPRLIRKTADATMTSRTALSALSRLAESSIAELLPDAGGIIRTTSVAMGFMEVNDQNKVAWHRAESAAAELEAFVQEKKEAEEEVEAYHVRLLARVKHLMGVYLKASNLSQEALPYLAAEAELLEALVRDPPEATSHNGSSGEGRPWPQDRRALSACRIDMAEATEDGGRGSQTSLKRACSYYARGLGLELPGERTVNNKVRERYEGLKCRLEELKRAKKAGKSEAAGRSEEAAGQSEGGKPKLEEPVTVKKQRKTLPAATLPTQAEGYELPLSAKSSSGYRNVKLPSSCQPVASVCCDQVCGWPYEVHWHVCDRG